MRHQVGRTFAGLAGFGLAALGLLTGTAPAWAQFTSGSGSGSGSSGGFSGNFGGSSSGGFGSSGGSSSGGFGSGSSGGSSSGNFGSGSFGSGSSGGGSSGLSGGSPFGTMQQGLNRSTSGTGSYGTMYQGPAASNPFASYYADPIAAGLPGVTRTTFGVAPYNLTTTASLTTGSAGSLGGTSQIGSGEGYSAVVPQVSPYVATLAFASAPPTSGKVFGEVEQVLARSSALSSKDKIQIAVLGQAVLLRGQVADDHERRLAEALVRLTPGVHDVRNELTVKAVASAAVSPP